MRNYLNPKEIEKIKQILKKLTEIKVSEKGREKFFSKLDQIPERKEAFDLASIKERVYYASQDILERIQVSFTQPVPALARVAIVLLVLWFGYSYAFLPKLPIVHDIKGTVKIFDASKNEWSIAKNKQKLQKGDIIKTFQDGRVDLSSGDIYSMRLKKDSEVKVGQLRSRLGRNPISFNVAKGKVFTYYSPRASENKKEFILKTDEAIATALGTDFMLEAMPVFEKTWVGVLEGVVKVQSLKLPKGISPEKAAVYVKSRFKTEVFKGETPKRPKMMIEDEWLSLEELYSIGKKPQVALLISAGSTRTRELLSMAPLYISDKKPSVLPDKLKEIAEVCNQAVKESSPDKHAEAIKQFEKLLEDYPNPQYEGQFLLFIATYYEYLYQHEKAIETFQKVISKYPKSPLASIAQCAIGIIYEERLEDKPKAEEAYRKVLSLYPASPEAEEAEAGLKRLSQ